MRVPVWMRASTGMPGTTLRPLSRASSASATATHSVKLRDAGVLVLRHVRRNPADGAVDLGSRAHIESLEA